MAAGKKKLTRSQWLTFGLFFLIAIFVIRLFYIQVVEHAKYTAKADAMQVNKQTINPTRGLIYVKDQDGTLSALVLNQRVYTIFVDPTQINNADKVKQTISSIAGGNIISGSLDKITDKSTQYVVVARQVSYENAEKIKQAGLAGVGTQSTSKRVYPEGKLASQILGFVNADGKGQYGLEQYLNDDLTGSTGLLESVTDVSQIPLTIGTHDVSVPAKNGTNHILSIDRSVQAKAEEVLATGLQNVGSDSGSIVVMDPQTGRIVAMANYPDYDVSNYSSVKDASVFQNSAVSSSFEPGSVMKTLTTGMALDLGVIKPSTTFTDPGCYQVDDAKVCNAEGDEKFAGQTFTMTKVLQYSLNTGVIWQLKQIGGGEVTRQARQAMYEFFANRYRFGKKTGIEQPYESAGTIFSPDNEQGGNVRYANMTFGQGIAITAIQMAGAYSAAVNGGTYYQPTLIYGTVDNDGNETEIEPKVVEANVLNSNASNDLKTMMFEARRASYPTSDNGYYVGSKTGSAQVYDETTRTYSKTKSIGTMIGFGADKNGTARYVIMVRGNYEGSGFAGSKLANPIFTNMSNWLADYEGLTK